MHPHHIDVPFTSSFSLLMDMKLILEVVIVLKLLWKNSIKTSLEKLNVLFNSAFLKDSKYLEAQKSLLAYHWPLTLFLVTLRMTLSMIG